MELFVDTCDAASIAAWLGCGVATGVTTNPVLLARSNDRDREALVARLVALAAPHPIAVQVGTAESEDAVVAEGRRLAAVGSNVVVKVASVSPEGASQVGAVHRLAADGISVNVTACLTVGQAVLAAAAGASYVSLLCGRIADDGGDPVAVLRAVRAWTDESPRPVRVLAASVRTPADFVTVMSGRPHVVTVPPGVLDALADHPVSRATAAEFLLAAAPPSAT